MSENIRRIFFKLNHLDTTHFVSVLLIVLKMYLTVFNLQMKRSLEAGKSQRFYYKCLFRNTQSGIFESRFTKFMHNKPELQVSKLNASSLSTISFRLENKIMWNSLYKNKGTVCEKLWSFTCCIFVFRSCYLLTRQWHVEAWLSASKLKFKLKILMFTIKYGLWPFEVLKRIDETF